MASTQTHGYQPVALPDWQGLLQSLAVNFALNANHPEKPPIHWIDAKSRAGLIRLYITDQESCLEKANAAIRYYEDLIQNYDRLVAVMEESRNQAYDMIGLLKNKIDIAKEYRPLADEPRTGKEDSHE